MKQNMKKVVATLLAAIMVLGLTGCIKSFNATEYVQAELDLLTRHDVKQYVEVLGVSEEEAEEIYDEIIEEMNISESLLQGEEAPDEVMKGLEEWFIKVLSKTKYTVLEAEEKDGDYIVVVDVEPVKAFEGMTTAITTETESYMQQVFADIAAGGETPSDEQINNDMTEMLLGVLNGILEDVTYGEKVSVETKIVQNEDGEYEIDEKSFEELGAKLLDPADSTSETAETEAE